MWWAGVVACYVALFYCLYRALRLPLPAVPPVPEVLSVRVLPMSDQIGVTLRPILAAPSGDASITGYTFDATVAGNAVPSATLAFGAGPAEFVGNPGDSLVVAYRYVNSTGPGPAGPQLTMSMVIPAPTLAPPIPEVASVRVIAAAPTA